VGCVRVCLGCVRNVIMRKSEHVKEKKEGKRQEMRMKKREEEERRRGKRREEDKKKRRKEEEERQVYNAQHTEKSAECCYLAD
jgi:hypothetical protein